MMGGEKVGIKTDEQGSKLAYPGETALAGEAPLTGCQFGVSSSGRNRYLCPLKAGVQALEDVVEDSDQRDLADVPLFGGAWEQSDRLLELFFGFSGRDSALETPLVARFCSHDAVSPIQRS